MIRFLALSVFIVIAVVALAGCTPARSITCPTVKEYSDEFKQVFLGQYQALVPEGSVLDIFIIDAIELRDEARVCLKR